MESPWPRNVGQHLHRRSLSMDWRTTTAVLLLVLGITVKTVSGGPHPLFSHRIVGGQEAQLGKWPWHTCLIYKTTAICGASLISKNWAVTAAHCFDFRDYDEFKIMAGVLSLNGENPSRQIVQVKKVIIHPMYVGDGKSGDLALLELTNDVNFNTNIKPISLPAPNQTFENGKTCWLCGWGRLSENDKLPSPYTLREVELPLINSSECNKMFKTAFNLTYTPTDVTKYMICAGYPEGKKDGCQGDSGGGLVCKYDEVWLLVGIVSWGDGCAERMKPGVYTLVNAFYSWILEQMNGNPSSELNTATVKGNTSITEQPKVASQDLTLSLPINQGTTSAGRRLQIPATLLVVVIVWTRILDVA